MKAYQACELKSGKRLNPRPRQAPRCYAQVIENENGGTAQPHEVLAICFALVAMLSFTTLCVVIA